MARRIVVVINGRAGAGKDHVARHAITELAFRGWTGENFSSIEPVRQWLRDFGIPVDRKTHKERDLLAEIKAALEKYDFTATRMIAKKVKAYQGTRRKPNIAFVHMREPASIKVFKSLFEGTATQVLTLLVVRPGIEQVNTNAADAGVEGMDYDVTILNDSDLNALDARIDAWLAELRRPKL